MAQYQRPDLEESAGLAGEDGLSGWTLGFVSFAALMMLLLGTFHIFGGLAALIDGSFYNVRPNYGLELDTTAWGILHLISGILLLAGSIGILFGALWARIICIGFAAISAVFNFYSIPYYPIWSITMIALSIGVIWALVTHPDYADEV
jgi:hypothetical protein